MTLNCKEGEKHPGRTPTLFAALPPPPATSHGHLHHGCRLRKGPVAGERLPLQPPRKPLGLPGPAGGKLWEAQASGEVLLR